MLNKSWRFRTCDETAALTLAASLGVSPTVGRLLAGRGIRNLDAASSFFQADLGHLHDPSLLPDIDRASARIAKAVREKEPLLVHGDYDVDGVCSAALLTRGLKALGGAVSVHVPHRVNDGYDLQVAAVEGAARNGISLIVTTDCGIQAVEAVEAAKALGVEVVVTDHHEPGEILPDAAAVVNPRRADSRYPFPAICGTAVAFKVLQATARALGEREEGLYRAFLDLVAIGTVADMMPLVDENRDIVRFGLDYLAQTRKPGLRALLSNCIKDRHAPTVEDISFQIGPRINAVGRMADSRIALELLLCTEFEQGRLLAGQMETINLQRRKEQDRIFREVQERVMNLDLSERKVLVLWGEAWPTGLVGPVASRLVEAYRKPTFLISHDGEIGRGSARSVGQFGLMNLLDNCRDLMERCGGHQQAAGFDVPVGNLEAFEERLQRLADEWMTPEDCEDCLEIDAALSPSEVCMAFCRELELLQPFGHGHHNPLFASRFTTLAAKPIGKSGEHLKLIVRGDGLEPSEVVFWRRGADLHRFVPGEDLLLCYRLGVNRYAGRENLQLEGVDVKPADALELPVMGAMSESLANPFVLEGV
jgi:single-stranded-DNA-specific exonuclease